MCVPFAGCTRSCTQDLQPVNTVNYVELQSLMQGAECFFMWDSDEDACHLLSHETFCQMSMLKSGFWEDESGSAGRPGVEVEALRRQASWCNITAQ